MAAVLFCMAVVLLFVAMTLFFVAAELFFVAGSILFLWRGLVFCGCVNPYFVVVTALALFFMARFSFLVAL